MTRDPLRIGLLGASRIAVPAVTEAAALTGDELAAVAARGLDRAAAYAGEHGYARAYGSYEELLADPEIDLVYVGLPNGLHPAWTVRAAEAGHDVLCEKPFAPNLAEFDEAWSRIARTGRRVVEAYHYQHHPVFTTLLEAVRSGRIGRVRGVEIRMLMPRPADGDPRWSYDLAGGALMDLGCYALHASVVLAELWGQTVRVNGARATPFEADPRVDLALSADLAAGDVPIAFTCSMDHAEFDFALRVVGERGSVTAPGYVRPMEDDRVEFEVDGQRETVHVGTTPSYVYQLRRVGRALAEDDRAWFLGQRARSREVARLIDACYDAAGLPLRPTYRPA